MYWDIVMKIYKINAAQQLQILYTTFLLNDKKSAPIRNEWVPKGKS
jgi:hypothetical protein